MKLSNACIFGLVGGIILCLNVVINFVQLMSSEYYTPNTLNIFLWVNSFVGWALMIVFFVFLLKNSKKLDKIFGHM